LLPIQHWVQNFTITQTDIESLINLLMENETPMTSDELLTILLEKHIEEEKSLLTEQYEGTMLYQPVATYEIGDRLIFPQFDYETATVTETRHGISEDYGEFSVISVKFDKAVLNNAAKPREFAANFQHDHALNTQNEESVPFSDVNDVKVEDILGATKDSLMQQLTEALLKNEVLVKVANYWFPGDLMMEIDIGQLHLAEAVLDMHGGGPLSTEQILEEIGGLGDAPRKLQLFSMNLALDEDKRFDEVGPAGQVVWYLNRMEPELVNRVPKILVYDPITYDKSLLTSEMVALEQEIRDELSDITDESTTTEAAITLIYPHRRMGTLPVNAATRKILPTAKTPRIFIELVDEEDDEVFTAWVVHQHRYVYGLEAYYAKHHLPVGAHLTLKAGEQPGQYIIGYDSHRSLTEWIRLFEPHEDQITFDTRKRSIGAGFDDLVIVGVDNLEAVDAFFNTVQEQQRSLAALLRSFLTELSRLTPQGTVHAKTLYSVVNIIRRCPPGPIFATLVANPDFEDVDNHYWKISSS